MGAKLIRISLALVVCLKLGIALAAEELSAEFIAAELERARTKPDSSVTVRINAPIDYVFSFLTLQLDKYAADAIGLQFDHSNSRTTDALDVGSLRISQLEDGDQLVQRFLLFDAPNEYAYLTDMELSTADVPLKYSITNYQLRALNQSGTRLSVNVAYQPSSRLLGFIVRRAFRSALERDFNEAAAIIEAAHAAGVNPALREAVR